MARVGRYKAGKKLGWERRLFGLTLHEPIVNPETGEVVVDAHTQIGASEVQKSKIVASFQVKAWFAPLSKSRTDLYIRSSATTAICPMIIAR